MTFVIFFSVALLILGSVNYYIAIRGWQALPDVRWARICYLVLFLVLSVSFIAGRILERISISWLSSALVWIGAFWLGAMVYFLLAVITLDLFRAINHFLPFFPKILTDNWVTAKHVAGIGIAAIVTIVVIAGHINALRPVVRTMDITINKSVTGMKSLSIAAISDVHLGTLVCNHHLLEIVEKMNALDPDVVLLPGDVIDEDLGPVLEQDLGETLRSIRSRYGVFSVTGNHEYIGGGEQACRYLSEHGITVLRDTTTMINGSIYLVGREDLSKQQFLHQKRKSLNELMENVDRNKPIIVMDHQPFRLNEAQEQGIDLQLSGHTHHGQLWPFNFITKKVYELSWGYLEKGSTHYYVSCGVGTWGPPIRLGNRPEILNIRLQLNSQ